MKNKIILDEKLICEEYLNFKIGVETLALKYHVGKVKIKDILSRNNIERKKRGGQSNDEKFIVEDWGIEKYPEIEGKHYLAIEKETGFVTKDVNNRGGHLTSYINKIYGIEIPTLYDRRMYYMRTGNYWWEQWFDVKLVNNAEVKKCPYCEWETVDVNNNSGAFEQHLKKEHNITKIQYLKEYPEEREYFRLVNKRLDRQMETDENKFVICKICGEKMARISNSHLKTHNITKIDYILKYGHDDIYSQEFKDILLSQSKKMNLSMDGRTDIFTSKAESEILQFIQDLGFECTKNRAILDGQELDIFIPSKNLAIEYNGNKWHTEFFGRKGQKYHLNKLNRCLDKNINLIQIFEDEYALKPLLVKSKIKHILGVYENLQKIPGRKCTVKEIDSYDAEYFLEMNHIQGYTTATIHLGAYYENSLIAVMSFIRTGKNWELSRFASDNNVICQGVGGKIFNYFTKNYEYDIIKSFADRRWTINYKSNLYVKLGFKFNSYLPPTYTYYNPHVDRFKRFHKFGFRKQKLNKKYGLPLAMTEIEMAKELGYDRIWDCGLIKYVYTNPSLDE